MSLILHIKNMVCNRCIHAVNNEFVTLGLHPLKIVLGEVLLQEDTLTPEVQEKLDAALKNLGFERIDNKRSQLIEKIKNYIIHEVHNEKGINRKLNWSVSLSEEMHYEYNYLSYLFSSVEGITLEQYIIRQKIERVKELLLYDQLSLSEIAHKLAYSSVQHLSNQFKKITGFTPSQFKKLRDMEHERKSLDAIR